MVWVRGRSQWNQNSGHNTKSCLISATTVWTVRACPGSAPLYADCEQVNLLLKELQVSQKKSFWTARPDHGLGDRKRVNPVIVSQPASQVIKAQAQSNMTCSDYYNANRTMAEPDVTWAHLSRPCCVFVLCWKIIWLHPLPTDSAKTSSCSWRPWKGQSR